MHPALSKILKKTNNLELLDQLKMLSQRELTTLLLNVFQEQATTESPAQLLKRSQHNRFIQRAPEPLMLKQLELTALTCAQNNKFTPVELGPVAPLGASSTFGKVHQNKVLSALRSCEVVSDPSNLMAILMAQEDISGIPARHWASSHRTLRSSALKEPNQSPHFQLLAACSLWHKKAASVEQVLDQHLRLQYDIFNALPLIKPAAVRLKLWRKPGNNPVQQAAEDYLKHQSIWPWETMKEAGSDYYQGFQLKTYLQVKGTWLETADCGWVNWAQELTGNKRLACLISGVGLERLLLE